MFPGEYIALLRTADDLDLSLFVSESVIRVEGLPLSELNGVEVPGQLQVRIVDQDERFSLVALPGQPVDGSRFAKVARF